jgi:hypothetical protein
MGAETSTGIVNSRRDRVLRKHQTYPRMDLNELSEKVGQFDSELSSQLTQIVALERKVANLTAITQDLFVLCSSVQRFSDAQENAFKAITERLKHREPNT